MRASPFFLIWFFFFLDALVDKPDVYVKHLQTIARKDYDFCTFVISFLMKVLKGYLMICLIYDKFVLDVEIFEKSSNLVFGILESSKMPI